MLAPDMAAGHCDGSCGAAGQGTFCAQPPGALAPPAAEGYLRYLRHEYHFYDDTHRRDIFPIGRRHAAARRRDERRRGAHWLFDEADFSLRRHDYRAPRHA